MDWRNAHRTLRLVLPRHGGDRLHLALPAALPRREGAVGPGDRDRLDPGGAGRPGAVPGRSLVGPDRIGASPSWSSRSAVAGASPRLLRGAQGVVWLGVAGRPVRRERHLRAPSSRASPGPRPQPWPPKGGVGAALGALRFWKPIGIVLVALVGSWIVGAVRRRRDPDRPGGRAGPGGRGGTSDPRGAGGRTREAIGSSMKPLPRRFDLVATRPRTDGCRKDAGLWASSRRWSCSTRRTPLAASTSGCSSSRDLHAPERMLAYAFVVSMVAWMIVVWPAGWLADRCGASRS